MAGDLKAWKKEDETKFLKCVHSQALQQTLKYLDRAFKDGFKKDKGFPRFKKKATIDPFAILKVSSEKGIVSIFLKLDGASSKKVESVEGVIKNTTVSIYCGHWYVSFQTELILRYPSIKVAR